MIIYVVCHNDESEKIANDQFSKYDWARVLRLKEQNHLFEGVVYTTELLERYHEWKDHDFVGTISYSILKKVTESHMNHIVSAIRPELHDVAFFHTDTSDWFYCHPNFVKSIYYELVNNLLPRHLSANRWGFFSCWMAKPYLMVSYISFFNNIWLPRLEAHPDVWRNAEYGGGTLSKEHLLKLTKRVEHYPCHPFINERLPFQYFSSFGLRILF
jgi:hypothetical protein